jgi:hypothetical protein
VSVVTIIVHRSCSTTVSLPPYRWISTNGSTVPYTLGQTSRSAAPSRSQADGSDDGTSSSTTCGTSQTVSSNDGTSSSGTLGTSASSDFGSTTVVQTFSYSVSQAPLSPVTQAVITTGAQTHTVIEGSDPNMAIVDGTTLSVGGPPATIGGQVYSAVPSGVVVLPTANSGNSPPCATAGTLNRIICPTADGTIYTPAGDCIGSNTSYIIDCGTSYAGNDVNLISGVADPATCIAHCTDDAACVAVAFDSATNSCLEKRSVALGSGVVDPGVVFALNLR